MVRSSAQGVADTIGLSHRDSVRTYRSRYEDFPTWVVDQALSVGPAPYLERLALRCPGLAHGRGSDRNASLISGASDLRVG